MNKRNKKSGRIYNIFYTNNSELFAQFTKSTFLQAIYIFQIFKRRFIKIHTNTVLLPIFYQICSKRANRKEKKGGAHDDKTTKGRQ